MGNRADAQPGDVFGGYDVSDLYYGSSEGVLDLVHRFNEWNRDRAVPNGYYLYSQALQESPRSIVHVRTRKTGDAQRDPELRGGAHPHPASADLTIRAV
jgi:hypothetical protein